MHISKLPRHDWLPAQYIVNNLAEEEPQKAANSRLCEEVLTKLLEHYPGHPWLVQIPNNDSGVVVIKHPMLSALYGMVVKITTLNSDPSMHEVVRMGGEMLERWGQKRAGLSFDEMMGSQPQFCDVKLIGRG